MKRSKLKSKGLDMDANLAMVGKRVRKLSPKPFKSGSKVNTVKAVVPHPVLNILAFTFEEDDSIVECRRCVIVKETK